MFEKILMYTLKHNFDWKTISFQ